MTVDEVLVLVDSYPTELLFGVVLLMVGFMVVAMARVAFRG